LFGDAAYAEVPYATLPGGGGISLVVVDVLGVAGVEMIAFFLAGLVSSPPRLEAGSIEG
jgi:hypothetical protein